MQKQQHTQQGFTRRPRKQTGGNMKKETRRQNIAYQNKDITSKVLAERFQGKTFRVYGLDLPKIVKAGPTNIPIITANELRLDNLFELADQTVAIVDYESRYKKEDKIKYLNYLAGIANRYRNEKKTCPALRMIVIYTGDVKRKQVSCEYQIGALTMRIEAAFLSELDADGIFGRLTEKIQTGKRLTEEELMEYMILPLSLQTQKQKRQKAAELAELAVRIKDREQQLFVMAGLLVFADKILDMETANKIKEIIHMNKVEWLIRQEERRECEAEKRQALAEAEKNFKKEKKRELKRAAKRYEKEKQEYEAKQQEYEARQQEYEVKEQEYEARQQEYEARQQEYEAKMQYMIKWMAAKGYAADEIFSEFRKESGER